MARDGDEPTRFQATDEDVAHEKDQTNDFEDERCALLNSMATKLRGVIERMAKVNENLDSMSADSDVVSDVGKLWRESYQARKDIHDKKDRGKDGCTEQQQKSSLLVFTRGL